MLESLSEYFISIPNFLNALTLFFFEIRPPTPTNETAKDLLTHQKLMGRRQQQRRPSAINFMCLF